MAPDKVNKETKLGIVTEALPDTMFRVQLDDGAVLIAYLAGKMRLHRIKVLVGDRVEIVLEIEGIAVLG